MRLREWLERQAPDFVNTWRRFPLAIGMAAMNVAIVLGAINGVSWLQEEVWARAALGLATGAVLAVAGVFFAESRPEARRWAFVLKYLLPLAAVGLLEISEISWFVPFLLPVIAILWLSVSPFTRIERGAAREEQQHRFWLINHRAFATAVIAGGAFAIISLGFLIIERSLSILFGLETGELFYRWLLPFTGLFLTPVYWLSTLPRLSEVHASEAEQPELIGKAVGFLGQFVLVPLLFIYALILLAYTLQIVLTQELPQGMIGWMVMGFVIVGAATWLVLHPPFMRARPLVRLFRRLWFWLTLVPLLLFFFAVWVRVDAYGLTAERMLLAAGGIWALGLAVVFLTGRGDIRLIPALAGALLLLLSVGPWNYLNLPIQHQLLRLDVLVANAGADKTLSPPRPDWNAEEIADARGIIDYLTTSREGRSGVREVMGRYGINWDAGVDGSYAVLEALGVNQESTEGMPRYATLWRDYTQPVDVSETPYLIRPINLYGVTPLDASPLRVWIEGSGLRIAAAGTPDAEAPLLDLSDWLAKQTGTFIAEPVIPVTVAGRDYKLVVQGLTVDRGESNAGPVIITSLEVQLFAAQPPTPTP